MPIRSTSFVISCAVSLSIGCGSPQAEFDLLIQGGTVVDGTGAPAFDADVAIRDRRIVRIDREGISPDRAKDVLDAEGLIVAPGFIDNHAHIQTSIHEHPLAENFMRQGITTILASLHSGDQPWPLDEYAASLDVAPNVGFFAGHSWTRERVMGLEDRAPTPAELEEMKALVHQTMQQGALGLATGLVYVPGNFAATEEIIELASVASQHGGIYVSHMRDEATGVLESVAEVIRIAAEAGLPGHINHHKVVGQPQWGWTERTLVMIDSARDAGLDITFDIYPYTASSTGSSVLFPQWALAGGSDAFAGRISDAETRARIETDMRRIYVYERAGNDMARIQFRRLRSDPSYDGKTLADLARDRGIPNTVDAAIDLLIELQLDGGFSAIYHAMDDADVQRLMRHPLAMFETDGDPVSYGIGHPHPRSYGAFPRILGRYVRELNVIPLEDAVRKMTMLPADRIGHADRGRITEGMWADITVFEEETIADRATFTDPHQYSVGIHHVIVNGVPVIRDAAFTGARPGQVLRRGR